MTAQIYGVDVEGTPEEIAQYARLLNGIPSLPNVTIPNTVPQYPNPYVDGRGWWADKQVTCWLPTINTYDGVPCTVTIADHDRFTRYIEDVNGRHVTEKWIDGEWRYRGEGFCP